MLPYCAYAGVAVTTFSPLARGYLASSAANARTAHDPYLKWFGDAIDREIARRVRQVADERGVSSATVAMAWVAGHAGVTAPLIGADTPDQVDAAIAAAALKLSEDERTYLEAPYRPRDMINDYNPLRRARALAEEDKTA
jgi:1-deoxyxylulose-5-phosphate synthase